MQKVKEIFQPIAFAAFIAGWIWLDAQTGCVFRAQILSSGLILSCLFFIKSFDPSRKNGKD
ncbi:MAG: hypothetical protein IPL49_16830 [Saprospirales bacterium]|nr:hypothetical protein [Saprospirales bacterium]MBK8492499.1 hypothetical protein [Saprospirales bacterium]